MEPAVVVALGLATAVEAILGWAKEVKDQEAVVAAGDTAIEVVLVGQAVDLVAVDHGDASLQKALSGAHVEHRQRQAPRMR